MLEIQELGYVEAGVRDRGASYWNVILLQYYASDQGMYYVKCKLLYTAGVMGAENGWKSFRPYAVHKARS